MYTIFLKIRSFSKNAGRIIRYASHLQKEARLRPNAVHQTSELEPMDHWVPIWKSFELINKQDFTIN